MSTVMHRYPYTITTDRGRLDYRQFGFKELANPSRMMEIVNPDVYRAP